MVAVRRLLFVLSAIATLASAAMAQDPYALRTAIGAEAYLWELRANQAAKRSQGTPQPNSIAPGGVAGRYTPPAVTSPANNARNYWAQRNQQVAMYQPPARPSFVQPAAATAPLDSKAAKPFAGADTTGGPTVSPYLQLFRQEFEQEASNYHAYVRPAVQLQRERRAEQQRRQADRLRPAPAARQTTASTPSGGVHSTRFGNTGRYYSGWRR